MKVTAVRTAVVDLPLASPIANATAGAGSIGCVLAYVDTDEGITGECLAWSLDTRQVAIFDQMIRMLAPSIVGKDPEYTERFWQESYRAIHYLGEEGIAMVGISTIDGALWDLKGKAANRPIHQLAGGARTKVPAYESSGLYLSRSTSELVAEAEGFVAAGFGAMKMRIGTGSIAKEAQRVRAIRQAIGSEVKLMADASRALTVAHTIRLGRRIEEYGLVWLEEPLPPHDLHGLAEVAAALDVPIASGESEYTRFGFREMLDARAADIWMPDLQRVGGVTDFLKVGHLADAHGIPVSPHFFTQYSLQLLGALPTGTYLEYMPWFDPLFREPIELRDGEATVPTRPGWGFTFDPAAVERFRI